MPDLDLVQAEAATQELKPRNVVGIVSEAPADFDSPLQVTIPFYDNPDYALDPEVWMPRSADLPSEGDACLISFDENDNPWVVAMEGIHGGSTPAGAAGGDLTGTYPNPNVIKATFEDTRSVATLPSDYITRARYHFKERTALGLPAAPSGPAYANLVGLRGWSGDTGGSANELAFGIEGVYHRSGTTAGGWGAWGKFSLTSEALLGDLNGTLALPIVDGELGAGADAAWTITNGSAQMTEAYALPRGNTAGAQKFARRWIRITTASAGNKRLDLFWLTRDTSNWQTGTSIVAEVYSTYPLGGYTRSVIGGAYGTALTLETVESYGTHPLRPTLDAEATVSGTIKEAHCYLDLPEYHTAVVQITYGHRDETTRPFSPTTGVGQMSWTPGLTTAGSGQTIDRKTVGIAQLKAEVMAGGWGVILTGGTVGTARPTTGWGQYIWIHDGASAPTNMADGDLWFDPNP